MSQVTDWITAISAAIGGSGTAGALLIAARAYARQVADARSEQANRVSAWFASDQADASGRTVVAISNTSGRAVYDCKVEVVDHEPGDTAMVRCGPGPLDLRLASVKYAILPPDKISAFAARGDSLLVSGPTAGVRLVFRDQAGTYWRRDEQGNLKEITKAQADAFPPTHRPSGSFDSDAPDGEADTSH
jgi:hypothetical protein